MAKKKDTQEDNKGMEVTHITSHYSYNGENSQNNKGRVRLWREIR